MATYFALLQYRNQPVEAVFAATDVAEENRVRECVAATRIQAMARMRRARKSYIRIRDCIIAMQRVYRGYCGRKKFLSSVLQAELQRQAAVFNHFATVIQRHFRGFYSRKWRSDFCSQKRYIKAIKERSEAVQQHAEEERRKQEAHVAECTFNEKRAQFVHTAANLHHLLSTAVRCGVLRPAASLSGISTIFGTNVEDELRVAASESLKTRKPPRHLDVIRPVPPVRGGSPVKQLSVGGGKYIPSLQSTIPYEADQESKLLDRVVDAKLAQRLHNTAFVARKAVPPPAPKSLNAESEYLPMISNRSLQRH